MTVSTGVPSGWPPGGALTVSSLSFASCYVYAPRAAGVLAEVSRRICERVKTIDALWLPGYARFVYQATLCDARLAAVFARDVTLVPVPGSARSGAAPWPALQLALAMSAVGLALPVWAGLRRQVAVRKSATAPSAARPSVRQHFESFQVAAPPSALRRIVLIDDVVTKGRTLLAAAARLQAELPSVDVRAFALIRTQGFLPHLDHLTESCHGIIRWAGGDARREP